MPDEQVKMTPEELKKRWETEEGKKFKEEIIRQLKANKHCMDWENLKVTLEDGAEVQWKDFPGVREIESKLEEEEFSPDKISWANYRRGDLRGIDLCNENLEHAYLRWAHLEHAIIGNAHLEHADLRAAHLQATNITGASFKLKSFWWRTGLINIIIWLYRKLGKDTSRFKLTILTGAEIKDAKMDSNPVMYRKLQDEQYLDDYAENHRFFYPIWLLSSNCGRSPLPLAIIVLGTGVFFGYIYAGGIPYPSWMPDWAWLKDIFIIDKPLFDYGAAASGEWWRPFYTSFTTLTTLGWSSANPVNGAAFWWHMAENLLSYVLLGYLIAVIGDLLTRRSG